MQDEIVEIRVDDDTIIRVKGLSVRQSTKFMPLAVLVYNNVLQLQAQPITSPTEQEGNSSSSDDTISMQSITDFLMSSSGHLDTLLGLIGERCEIVSKTPIKLSLMDMGHEVIPDVLLAWLKLSFGSEKKVGPWAKAVDKATSLTKTSNPAQPKIYDRVLKFFSSQAIS